jgi:hypothetical protein
MGWHLWRRMWLRQRAFLALAANLVGLLSAFVSGQQPQQEEELGPPESFRRQCPRSAASGRATLRFVFVYAAAPYNCTAIYFGGRASYCSCRWPPYARQWARGFSKHSLAYHIINTPDNAIKTR